MKVYLTRYYQSSVQTRSRIRVVNEDRDEVFSCYGLELPWRDNDNRVSCIPTGEYQVRPRAASESGKYDYDHFLIKDVPGRSYILIHAGNIYKHTLGCVLVGREFEDINRDGHPDVIYSKATLSTLRNILTGPFDLQVVRAETDKIGPAPLEEPSDISIDVSDLEIQSLNQ